VYELVFIIRGIKTLRCQEIGTTRTYKNDRHQSTGGDMGQDNISDDRGAEPVEGTCVFILFIFSYVKSGV
jgi:hypothetical protein